MSYRPNYQGGRRGGGGGRNRGEGRAGRGDRGGGGGGEQRWWDPVWRAQRLAQKAAEVIFLNFMIFHALQILRIEGIINFNSHFW